MGTSVLTINAPYATLSRHFLGGFFASARKRKLKTE